MKLSYYDEEKADGYAETDYGVESEFHEAAPPAAAIARLASRIIRLSSQSRSSAICLRSSISQKCVTSWIMRDNLLYQNLITK